MVAVYAAEIQQACRPFSAAQGKFAAEHTFHILPPFFQMMTPGAYDFGRLLDHIPTGVDPACFLDLLRQPLHIPREHRHAAGAGKYCRARAAPCKISLHISSVPSRPQRRQRKTTCARRIDEGAELSASSLFIECLSQASRQFLHSADSRNWPARSSIPPAEVR